MLLFLLQALNFIGAAATFGVIRYAWHGAFWLAALGGVTYFIAAWAVYLVFQSRRPDWWAPWDEGLPQDQRMLDAFVPALIVYALVLILIPVFEQAREKAGRQKQKPAIAQPAGEPGSP